MELDYTLIRDAVRVVDLDPEVVVRGNYSGRGMYGRECVGVVVDSPAELVRIMVALTVLVFERDVDLDMDDLAGNLRMDSVGFAVIGYFPGWTLAKINVNGVDLAEGDRVYYRENGLEDQGTILRVSEGAVPTYRVQWDRGDEADSYERSQLVKVS